MIPPLDPFAQEIDSIEIDPSRASERATAHLSPYLTQPEAAPGFYLLDDANGRFVVDREIGVVTLADEEILRSERNAVHGVKLRVIEPSGATYELEMQLRISGRVPQMIGADEFAAIAGLTDETILVAPRVPVLMMPKDEPVVSTARAWTRFAVAEGHLSRTPRVQPRHSFIVPELPASNEDVLLSFDGLPQSFPTHLTWSL